MNKAYSRVVWHNAPSTESPINETNLNKMDVGINTLDDRIITLDTTKAAQSDVLSCLSGVTYNTSTGVFVFTWKGGTSLEVDLNIEKIPVSFSMSPQGVITMTTADGTTYTADVASLIKTYTFATSSTIRATTVTDQSGNKTITLDIIDGSITESMLETNFLANCRVQVGYAEAYASAASGSATSASGSAEDSEAWAVGKRSGQDVPSTDPTYNNNAKYWAGQAQQAASSGVTSFNGRTGAVTPQSGDYTKSDVGLGNVDNTADANKNVAYAADSGTTNGHTVNIDVPANAVFTDTTYSVATTSADGLMSSTDKTNLEALKITKQSLSGAVSLTPSNNYEYSLTGVTSLTLTAANVNAHIFVTFGSSPTVTLSGFTKVSGDDITTATASETWELSLHTFNNGSYLIVKKWG